MKKLDLTGQKFGKLTCLRLTTEKTRGSYVWEVRCDCGKVIYVSAGRLRSGNTKSCGCKRRQKPLKDWTGQTFGNLTFVRPTDQRQHREAIWELLCQCGNTVYKSAYLVKIGGVKSCGCLKGSPAHRNMLSRRGRIKSRKHSYLMSSATKVWRTQYKDCDFETFYRLSQMACVYCGENPSRTYNVYSSHKNNRKSRKAYQDPAQKMHGNFTYNGLDRIDSSKGHTPDNIVPCCCWCNRMKSDKSREEFIAHVKKIASYLP